VDIPYYRHYANSKSEIYLYGANSGSVLPGWACPRHMHHLMLEINLVLEGTQSAEIGGVDYRQGRDELLLIPPMLLHSFKAETPLRYFVFHVQLDDPAFLQQLAAADLLLLPVGSRLHGELLPLVKHLMLLLEKNASRIRLFHAVYAVMDAIDRHLAAERDAGRLGRADVLPVRIAKEIEMLVAAPVREDEPIAGGWLAGIAETLGISRRHCLRVFQAAYRMSPRQYLSVLRQQEAMQLLADDAGTIELVSRRVGYENVQSFIRQFVKWTGMTPGAFRRSGSGETFYLTPLELER